MGIKDTFIVKLPATDAAWLERQATIFGTRSAVLRMIVRIVRELVAQKRLAWTFEGLEEILQGNKQNPGNTGASGMDGSTLGGPHRPPRRESYFSAASVATVATVRRRSEDSSSFFVTPFRATLRLTETILQ